MRGGEAGDCAGKEVIDGPEELANPGIDAEPELPDDRYESGLVTIALADRERPEGLDGSLIVLLLCSKEFELELLGACSGGHLCSAVSASSSSP